jgi:glycosyltransferase involved in cell wall biosynthesis
MEQKIFEHPLVSIIIPAYNSIYIEETLNSAAQQTWDFVEVIIVNDGSTDNTLDIINKYHDKPNWFIYSLDRNRGARFAYNYGWLHAHGTYMMFLDSDDVLLPNYVKAVVNRIQIEHADMGFSDLYVIDGTRKTNLKCYGSPRHPAFNYAFGGPNETFPANNDKLREVIVRTASISPRAIYHRRLFEEFGLEDSRLSISHDWLRHIAFILGGAKCVYEPVSLGYYRVHSQGNSQKNAVNSAVDAMRAINIVLTGELGQLTSQEINLVLELRKSYRQQLFQALAQSDMNTAQIISWISERYI